MAIAPGNLIKLRHVKFDNTYRHVLDFSDAGSQYAYFNSLGGYDLYNFTYQRRDGIIRVPVNAEDLYNINYVLYQNSNFGAKWFYAFVTKIEYVNDNTTFLHIETDVFQTWLFDWHFGSCFVEREHVPYDTLGEWTEPEPVTAEAYPTRAIQLSHNAYIGNQNIILYFSKPPGSISGVVATDEDSGASSATYEKFYYVAGSTSPFNACMADLSALEQAGEMNLICGIGTSFNDVIADQITLTEPVAELPAGGVAKNNKTWLYCYSMVVGATTYKLDVANCEGNSCTFVSRLNGGTNPYLSTEMTTIPGSPIVEYTSFPIPRLPVNSDINEISRSLKISLETLPFQMISGGLSAAAGAMGSGGANLGSFVGAMASPIGDMINTMGKYAITDLMPKQLSGYAPGNGRFSAAKAGIYLVYYSPKRTEFNAVDEFFTAFGYAVNRAATPVAFIRDTGRRANHNYIKTQNALCVASGGIPQDDFSKIARIFDAGVTVWHNPGTMGNYTVNNDPV